MFDYLYDKVLDVFTPKKAVLTVEAETTLLKIDVTDYLGNSQVINYKGYIYKDYDGTYQVEDRTMVDFRIMLERSYGYFHTQSNKVYKVARAVLLETSTVTIKEDFEVYYYGKLGTPQMGKNCKVTNIKVIRA